MINKYTLILSFFIFLFSCSQESKTAPDDNAFSYLESTQQNESDTPYEEVESEETIFCETVHKELIGHVIKREVEGQDKYLLELNDNLIIECEQNKTINTNRVILHSEEDMDFDLFLGGTVLAVGEVKTTMYQSYPIEINLIRMAPIKGM